MIRLFCLKLLLSIQSFTNPCNPVEFLILHMWLLGDSDTTRKEARGAGFGGCSGADQGLTRQEVTASTLGLAPSIWWVQRGRPRTDPAGGYYEHPWSCPVHTFSGCLASSDVNWFQPGLLWHLLLLLRVQVDMGTIILRPYFLKYKINVTILQKIWELG